MPRMNGSDFHRQLDGHPSWSDNIGRTARYERKEASTRCLPAWRSPGMGSLSAKNRLTDVPSSFSGARRRASSTSSCTASMKGRTSTGTGPGDPPQAPGSPASPWTSVHSEIAEAREIQDVTLSEEHDRFAWLPVPVASAISLPELVGNQIREVGRLVGDPACGHTESRGEQHGQGDEGKHGHHVRL